ncbi:MAG TPA: acetate--CoA ligase family protein [Burkholderiales bacterium]
MLDFALNPRSVAVVGASDNPHKVGGRPILYLLRYGFRGAIYPVNPARPEVQGLKAWPALAELPEAPELAVIAVAGEEAMRAVEECARRGVRAAVVMSSGFGETGEEGRRAQAAMTETAKRAGMRLIGPNCQGLANFGCGLVANFSTIFHELEARDGPVAIVSQSGANSQAIYQMVYEKGLGVRHVHATGNEADVTIADLALAVAGDEAVRLVLLYLEAIKDPQTLARAAALARSRDLPIVALKAGRTAAGQKAASSHTGAMASEDRVVDAFFERHGIWRAADPAELVRAAELYVSGRRPRGARLVFVSNSGASCVMAADHAESRAIPLAPISEGAKARLGKFLPAFASLQNPIDITGALLSNSKLFGQVLPVVGDDAQSELLLVGLPVAGTGYDVPGFARDLADFQGRYPHAVAVAATQPSVREEFSKAGVATFAREGEAMDALHQLACHTTLLRGAAPALPTVYPVGKTRFLNEADSLAMLAKAGIQVVEHRLCLTESEAKEARESFGTVVMKACSKDVPHKSDHGLVALDVTDPATEFRRQKAKVEGLAATFEGVIVARKAARGRELALGARLDPQFGPVVMVGDGGVYLEALQDFRLLLPPFTVAEAHEALERLRAFPLLRAFRGRPAADTAAFAAMAVKLGEAMLAWGGKVASVDVNPVIVGERGALAVDALVEVAV